MFAKMIIAAALALVAAQAAQYPAGVHPAICPDYPNCDTALLARFTPDGQPIPPWGLAAVAPVDTQYPAGVAPASCPNYPYCGSDLAAPRYPAGISPAACPNYPYCY